MTVVLIGGGGGRKSCKVEAEIEMECLQAKDVKHCQPSPETRGEV